MFLMVIIEVILKILIFNFKWPIFIRFPLILINGYSEPLC